MQAFGGFLLVMGILTCALLVATAVGMAFGKVQVEVEAVGDKVDEDDEDEPWRRSLRDDD
jgi:hypothetical protein